MVLVALLFLPCMVIVTTVAIPLLLLVIAVIAIPILLYYDCSSIMQIYPTTYSSSSYLSDESSTTVPLHNTRNRTAVSIPPAIRVSTLSSYQRVNTTMNIKSKRSSSSSCSLNKKKVTFQLCNDQSTQSMDGTHQSHQHPAPALCMTSSMEGPNASILYHRRRQSPYYFHSREAITTTSTYMDVPYEDALPQSRPDHIYHHPVCVS